jgi:hypothetical protein
MVINMVKAEIGTVKVQPRKTGGYMVTIPVAAIRGLGIKDNEDMTVYVDFDNKEITYKLR